jgi:hypothetical protein
MAAPRHLELYIVMLGGSTEFRHRPQVPFPRSYSGFLVARRRASRHRADRSQKAKTGERWNSFDDARPKYFLF